MVLYAIPCVVCITGQAYHYRDFWFSKSPERIKKMPFLAIISNEERLVNTLPYSTQESKRPGIIGHRGSALALSIEVNDR
jgi:hypothetical protein